MHSFTKILTKTKWLADALFPPACLRCDGHVSDQGSLCPACFARIHWLAAPLCACCGIPFPYALGEETRCGRCLAEPPSFAKARAVFRYDEASGKLITRFKYADRIHSARAYAGWMKRAGKELFSGIDLIVPVPLHFLRRMGRRYNQAELLAGALAKMTGLAYAPQLLKRKKSTKQQSGLSRSVRLKNVRGAFMVPPSWKEKLQGASILLIDDVLTTGATAEAASRTLLNCGAKEVSVLTLARTCLEG